MVHIGCKCGLLRIQMPVALPMQHIYAIDIYICTVVVVQHASGNCFESDIPPFERKENLSGLKSY